MCVCPGVQLSFFGCLRFVRCDFDYMALMFCLFDGGGGSVCVRASARGLLQPLRETLALLANPKILAECLIGLPIPRALLGEHDPLVFQETQFVEAVGSYAVTLVGERMKRQLWMSNSWLPALVGLLSTKPDRRDKSIEQIRTLHDAAQAALKKGQWWSSLAARSFVLRTSGRQVYNVLKDTAFQVDHTVKDFVTERLNQLGQSKIVEDSFCIGRKTEHDAANSEVAVARFYDRLVHGRLVEDIHHFKPVEWETHIPQEEVHIDESIFKPKFAELPPKLREITKVRDPDWFAPSATTFIRPFVESALLTHAHKTGRWEEVASRCRLSILCKCGLLVVRQKGSQEWKLVLAETLGLAALAWPVTQVGTLSGRAEFRPNLSEDVAQRWIIVTDLSSWECFPVSWTGPLLRMHL